MTTTFNLNAPDCDTVFNKLYLKKANPAWEIILVSGVLLKCRVGLSVVDLLTKEFSIPPEIIEKTIEAIFLNGHAVDKPEDTIVPDSARLALAAGLPGIVGLAMKKGSAVRALRPGITFLESKDIEDLEAKEGHITLALFSLILPLLAEHFLKLGVLVPNKKMISFLEKNQNLSCPLLFNDEKINYSEIKNKLATLDPNDYIQLQVGTINK